MARAAQLVTDRKRAKKQLENSTAFQKLSRLSPGPKHERTFNRLLDEVEVDAGVSRERTFTHQLAPKVIEHLLSIAPEAGLPIERGWRKELKRQRREMVAMRARGEIPMASMFPGINVLPSARRAYSNGSGRGALP